MDAEEICEPEGLKQLAARHRCSESREKRGEGEPPKRAPPIHAGLLFFFFQQKRPSGGLLETSGFRNLSDLQHGPLSAARQPCLFLRVLFSFSSPSKIPSFRLVEFFSCWFEREFITTGFVFSGDLSNWRSLRAFCMCGC